MRLLEGLLAWFLHAAAADRTALTPAMAAVTTSSKEGRLQTHFLAALALSGGLWRETYARVFPDDVEAARRFTIDAIREVFSVSSWDRGWSGRLPLGDDDARAIVRSAADR